MEKKLKIIVILLVVAAIVFAAGYAGKTTTTITSNGTQGASELVTTAATLEVKSEDMNENKTWTFAVMCDTRGDGTYYNNSNNTLTQKCINDSAIRAIAADIVKDGCDLVLVPGDMVYGGENNSSTPYDKQFKNWKSSMSPVYSAGIKVYTVRGNHEYTKSMNSSAPYDIVPEPAMENAYMKALGSDNPDNGPEGEKYLTYSFTHKNAFFLGLDEYAGPHTHEVNQEWVNSQLANNSQPHIFVFGHEPAFKLYHNDCLETYPIDRDKFWNSIGKAGCHVYFCGHDHFYNRALIQDDSGNEIYQVIDGSCGAPIKKWEISEYNENPRFKLKYHNYIDCGYVLVTVHGNDVNGEWKALNSSGNPEWVMKDSFQL